jgi:hypothetical protein
MKVESNLFFWPSSQIVLLTVITSMQGLYLKVGRLLTGNTPRDTFQRKIKQGPPKEDYGQESLWPLGIGARARD